MEGTAVNMVLTYGSPQPAGVDAGRASRARQLASACVTDGVTTALVFLAAQRGVGIRRRARGAGEATDE
jgi:hypothetical protein